jgi:Ca2+-binding EF-hand superfamily protein
VTNEIMQKVDKDHSGSIEMAEFAAMCHELDCAARDLEIELVFKSLDRNGDGFGVYRVPRMFACSVS